MNGDTIILLAVFCLYMSLLLVIGFISYRRGVSSAEDYFMAGRSFGTVVLFMSLFGTNVTAFALIGLPGIAYHAGVGVFGFFGAAAAFASPLCFILLGYPIWNLGQRHRFMTQSQMFGARWESQTIAYLLLGLLVFYTIPYLIIGLMGGGITIAALSGGTIAYPLATTVVALVTLIYTSLGGMRGTAWTNVAQATIFLTFLIVAFIGISSELGGIKTIHERLVAEAPHLLGKEHVRLSKGFWATGLLVGPVSVIAFPHIFMRILAARSTLALRRTIFIYPLALVILFIPVTLIGVWGALDIPGLIGKESDKILPLLVEKHLPVWLSAVGLAAILAAVMSSIDGQILTLSTMFAVDVMGRGRRTAVPRVGRITVVVITLLALTVAYFKPAGIFDISVYAFSGYTLIVPVMAFGIYWQRSTRTGILIGSLAGHTLLAAYYLGIPLPSIDTFPVFPALVVEIAVIIAVSFATPPPSKTTLQKFESVFAPAK